MNDRTNRTKPALAPTLNGIELMSNSIQALYQDVHPKSPAWFAVMASGSVKQLRDLLDDLEWLMEDMCPQGEQVEATVDAPERTQAAPIKKAA